MSYKVNFLINFIFRMEESKIIVFMSKNCFISNLILKNNNLKLMIVTVYFKTLEK